MRPWIGPIGAGMATTLAITAIASIATYALGIRPTAQEFHHAVTSASLGSLGDGHLVLDGASAGVTIHGGALGPKLYEARFQDSHPELQVSGSTVTIRQHPAGGPQGSTSGSQGGSSSSGSWHVSWSTSSSATWSSASGGSSVSSSTSSSAPDGQGDVTLNDSIPWAISARGPAAGLKGDLRSLQLSALDLSGGAAGVDLTLPRPSGTIPLRFSGGVSRLALHLPQGTAVQVRLSGGGAGVTLLHDEHGVVVGDLRWRTTGYEAASSRYDVEIAGGWAGITVDTAAG